MEELETLDEEIIEPFIPRYSIDNPPPEGRCGAIARVCKHPECDYMYPEGNDTQSLCPICKSPRKLCGSHPRKGVNSSGRCKFHGGAVPTGIMNANFKGRSISEHIPSRLLQLAGIYERDAKLKLLQFDDDVLLLETRKIDLLHRLDESDSKKLWNDLNKEMRKYRKFQQEYTSGKTASGRKMLASIDDIEKMLVAGAMDFHIWDEITILLEQQRKLKESELKRRKDQSTTITEDEAREMITGVLNIIKNRVKDQDVRNEIMNDINSMLMVKQ